MDETDESKTNYLDKQLINLVKARPALYDIRTPEKERTKLVKQTLWNEISNCLEGKLDPEAAESRWRYLRESYLRARKKLKIKEYFAKNTGQPLQVHGKNRKYSFRYHEIMEFLNDSLDHQKISPLNNMMKPKNVDNIKYQKLKKIQIVPIAPKPPTITLQQTNSPAHTTVNNVEKLRPFTFIQLPSIKPLPQNSSESENSSNTNNDPQINDYDKIFLECLQKPIEKPSPVDGFLLRLGEGLKRLPYRERSKLELEFLTRLNEVEEQLQLDDDN